MPTVLITDSLFFYTEHEQQLKAAGYDIERLDKPDATEEELITNPDYLEGSRLSSSSIL